jgi:hypothetical protein
MLPHQQAHDPLTGSLTAPASAAAHSQVSGAHSRCEQARSASL